ncbi:hypothetical protein Ddye_005775 [Dipteronia dyeriana]|uniref:MADS-box domain-containing protein n=1 Tax=Dipteronia dyeriana TaxID=168575 RepID=A0AAD9XH56_9ROSI|nr:hypothetical protein Ddye_005775 [Dipteronia dyeriana]
MGRKKIEMKLVKDKASRQVTFSKRRNGVFRKANELVTLCAAEVAIVAFSPGGKPFSFGHPSVEDVSQRFLNADSMPKPHGDDPKQEGGMQELNQELTEVLKQLEIEKKRGKALDKALADQSTCIFKKPITQLNKDELMNLKTALEKLHEDVKSQVSEIEASASLLLLNKATEKSDN